MQILLLAVLMSDPLSDQISNFFNSIRKLQARTHAEVGIVGAAIIEEQLLQALLAKMRTLRDH